MASVGQNPPRRKSRRMPAEWAAHAATLVAWPHQTADWPGKFAPIPWVYTEIVRRLAESEPVLLVVPPGAEKRVTGMLKKVGCDLKQVTLLPLETDRNWMRDSGPIGVLDEQGRRTQLDWRFNAWAKYDNWRHDDLLAGAVARHLADPCEQPTIRGERVVLEGGGIDANGEGLILTTEEWLLSDVQVRNPGLSRDDYQQLFADYLGCDTTVWLDRGIVGDDTHGHVDDVTRFVAPRTVLTAVESNAADPNHAILAENWERLTNFRDDRGGLEVIALPMPEPVVFQNQRLPASYANFYIGNRVVLVPTFNDAHDREALGILSELFPGRKVIGIHAVDLVWGLGTLHCLTQQIPAGL